RQLREGALLRAALCACGPGHRHRHRGRASCAPAGRRRLSRPGAVAASGRGRRSRGDAETQPAGRFAARPVGGTRGGAAMTTEAARYYLDLGLLPIPVPWREKAPKLDDWPNLRLGLADLPRYFNGAPANIGILLGNNGAADIDLDCSQAIAAAGELLP